MKKLTSILIVGLFGLSLQAHAAHEEVPGVIEKITDGDTVWVDPDDRRDAKTPQERLKIRMMELDAPETHLPSPNGVVGQGHWGDTATEVLADLVPKGTRVRVQDYGLDKYKRTLGTVFHKGEDVNLEMVRRGWAVTYIICEGKNCYQPFFQDHRVKEYVEACELAQARGLGIWNPKDPLKEMPFEFRVRMQEREFEKYVGNFSTKELVEPTEYRQIPECQRIFFMRQSEAKRVGYFLKSRSRFQLPMLTSVGLE